VGWRDETIGLKEVGTSVLKVLQAIRLEET